MCDDVLFGLWRLAGTGQGLAADSLTFEACRADMDDVAATVIEKPLRGVAVGGAIHWQARVGCNDGWRCGDDRSA